MSLSWQRRGAHATSLVRAARVNFIRSSYQGLPAHNDGNGKGWRWNKSNRAQLLLCTWVLRGLQMRIATRLIAIVVSTIKW